MVIGPALHASETRSGHQDDIARQIDNLNIVAFVSVFADLEPTMPGQHEKADEVPVIRSVPMRCDAQMSREVFLNDPVVENHRILKVIAAGDTCVEHFLKLPHKLAE